VVSQAGESEAMRVSVSVGSAYSDGENWDDVVAYVQAADRLGVDTVWSAQAWGMEAVASLGYLAAVTDRIRLGSGIMQISARTPAATALTALSMVGSVRPSSRNTPTCCSTRFLRGATKAGRSIDDVDIQINAQLAVSNGVDKPIARARPGMAFTAGGLGSATTTSTTQRIHGRATRTCVPRCNGCGSRVTRPLRCPRNSCCRHT
jgi:hypothetical protein